MARTRQPKHFVGPPAGPLNNPLVFILTGEGGRPRKHTGCTACYKPGTCVA